MLVRIGCIAMCVLVLVCGARAGDVIDAEAVALVERARAAHAALDGVRYEVERRVGDPAAGGFVVTGTVWQARADVSAGFAPGLYASVGTIRARGEEHAYGFGYDGSMLWLQRAGDRVVLQVPEPTVRDASGLLGFELGLIPVPMFTRDEAFVFDGGEGRTLRAARGWEAGPGAVGVELEFDQETRIGSSRTSVRMALDEESLLLRVYETSGYRVEIRDLAVLAAPDAALFGIRVPEGFEVRTARERDVPGMERLLDPGAEAPVFRFVDSEGEVADLAAQRGRVTVLDFSADWCLPCKRAMPALDALARRFADRRVDVWCLDVMEREGRSLVAHVEERGYTFRLVLEADSAAAAYGVRGVPVTYVVGPRGRVLWRHFGAAEDLEARLTGVIEEALRVMP